MGKSSESLTADPVGTLPKAVPGPAPRTPTTGAEAAFAEVLAGVLGVEHVPVDGHVFDDLGADSMLMAQFCARVRKRPDLPRVSIKDIYQHPTIAALAAALAPATTSPEPATTQPATPAAALTSAPARPAIPQQVPWEELIHPPAPPGTTTRTVEYYLCGALQLLIFLGYSFLAGLVFTRGYQWISGTTGLVDVYLRSVVVGAVVFVGMCVLPIVAKWVLIGRWTEREIRVWSLGYLRFWFVKTLVRSNPLALLFPGTPLYPMYLRALGARIGPGVAIFSRHVPICTDLLTIGAGTVVSKESWFLCYAARDGVVRTGPVTVGSGAFVGEKTVLEIGSRIGDAAQLGHTSSLYAGQAVPDGERWHGSPAVPAAVNYHRIAPARCSRLRQVSYSTFALLRWFLVYLPLAQGGAYALVTQVPALRSLLGADAGAVASGAVLLYALVLSAVVFVGLLVVGLLMVGTVPRLLSRLIVEDEVYPLYGFRYGVHRAIERLSNRRFFTFLFGDASAIVHYLRWIGYRFGTIEQTGSNFGMEVTQEHPLLTRVGAGTMVADALFILNADYSSTSFRVSEVSIGAHNFLGNHIAYPAGGRTGENCLLATKVMVPLDGEVREGVGLLGSPCFEIPRSVARDSRFDHLATGEEKERRLRRKNRYDTRTMGIYLVARWFSVFLLTALGLAAVDLYSEHPDLVGAAFFASGLVVTTAYFVLVERALALFRRLQPQYCSIYEPYFWWHERFWKVPSDTHLRALDGTPFKPFVWRLLGVRIGRRVFDDGCFITERTLTAIGDGCTLNQGSKIQCHSQEDGTFKSDRITIGAGSTLGVGALVHYGTTLGDGSVIAPDSFLMKGEEVPPLAHWGGNPAREMTS